MFNFIKKLDKAGKWVLFACFFGFFFRYPAGYGLGERKLAGNDFFVIIFQANILFTVCCDGCFSGRDPVEVPETISKNKFDQKLGNYSEYYEILD